MALRFGRAWRWDPETKDAALQTQVLNTELLGLALVTAAEAAALTTIRVRGEPTTRGLLHASAYAGLVEEELLARAAAAPENGPSPFALITVATDRAFETAPMVRLADQEKAEETLWWLADSDQGAEAQNEDIEPPLADRVESLVWALLNEQPIWHLEELVNSVYGRFPGPLTPDLTLVQTCIDSYSVQRGETRHLRPEDDAGRRAAEVEALRGDLAALGKRMGFQVRLEGGWDLRWLEKGRETHAFAISATAALGPYLLRKRAADEGAQRCLVLPGGRAQLVGLKLQRDPRLAGAVKTDGWQFVKFRHLRRLVAEEDLDRHAVKTVLGLDPIAEREAAQIPLF